MGHYSPLASHLGQPLHQPPSKLFWTLPPETGSAHVHSFFFTFSACMPACPNDLCLVLFPSGDFIPTLSFFSLPVLHPLSSHWTTFLLSLKKRGGQGEGLAYWFCHLGKKKILSLRKNCCNSHHQGQGQHVQSIWPLISPLRQSLFLFSSQRLCDVQLPVFIHCSFSQFNLKN